MFLTQHHYKIVLFKEVCLLLKTSCLAAFKLFITKNFFFFFIQDLQGLRERKGTLENWVPLGFLV